MSTQLQATFHQATPKQTASSFPGGLAWPVIDTPAKRHERILAIREQIAARTYESSERLADALEGLLEDAARSATTEPVAAFEDAS